MKSFDVRAVLFDLDGTLVDSTLVVERTWTRWAEKHGLEPQRIIAFAHGRPTADTVHAVMPHLDAAMEAGQLLAEEELDPTPVRSIPGALDAVTIASSHAKWAVVTSASRKLALLRLKSAGFPEPQVLISADDVKRGKPDPEGFLEAAARLEVSPQDCVVFEDTPAGVEAGKAARAKVIGLSTTFPKADLHAEEVVADLRSVKLQSIGDGWLHVWWRPL